MPASIMSLRLIAVTSAAFLSFGTRSVFAVNFQCYFPDGTTTTPDIPCNQSAIDAGGHSPCCNELNMCLDNGLCFGGGVVSRGSCTDSSWGEDCPQYCKSSMWRSLSMLNSSAKADISCLDPTGGNPMYPCEPFSSTWACGFNNTDCQTGDGTFTMEGGNGFILRGNQVAALEGGSSSVAILVEPTTTLTPATNDSASSPSGSTSSSATQSSSASASTTSASQAFTAGDIAGAAVGVGVPLLLALIGAIVMFCRLDKAR